MTLGMSKNAEFRGSAELLHVCNLDIFVVNEYILRDYFHI